MVVFVVVGNRCLYSPSNISGGRIVVGAIVAVVALVIRTARSSRRVEV